MKFQPRWTKAPRRAAPPRGWPLTARGREVAAHRAAEGAELARAVARIGGPRVGSPYRPPVVAPSSDSPFAPTPASSCAPPGTRRDRPVSSRRETEEPPTTLRRAKGPRILQSQIVRSSPESSRGGRRRRADGRSRPAVAWPPPAAQRAGRGPKRQDPLGRAAGNGAGATIRNVPRAGIALERFTLCAALWCDAPPWPSRAAAGLAFPQR